MPSLRRAGRSVLAIAVLGVLPVPACATDVQAWNAVEVLMAQIGRARVDFSGTLRARDHLSDPYDARAGLVLKVPLLPRLTGVGGYLRRFHDPTGRSRHRRTAFTPVRGSYSPAVPFVLRAAGSTNGTRAFSVSRVSTGTSTWQISSGLAPRCLPSSTSSWLRETAGSFARGISLGCGSAGKMGGPSRSDTSSRLCAPDRRGSRGIRCGVP
jgi:hypothetical protein